MPRGSILAIVVSSFVVRVLVDLTAVEDTTNRAGKAPENPGDFAARRSPPADDRGAERGYDRGGDPKRAALLAGPATAPGREPKPPSRVSKCLIAPAQSPRPHSP